MTGLKDDAISIEMIEYYQATCNILPSIFTPAESQLLRDANNLSDFKEEFNNWKISILENDCESGSEIAITLFEWFQAEEVSEWDEIVAILKRIVHELEMNNVLPQNQMLHWHQIGILLNRLGQQKDALDAINRSLTLSNQINIDFSAPNYYEAGIIYRDSGKYSLALEMFEKAETTAQKNEDLKTTIYAKGQGANIWAIRGDFQKTIDILNGTLELWNQFPDEEDRNYRHTTLHTLGRTLVQMHHYQEALAPLKESLNIKLRIPERFDSIMRTRSYYAEALAKSGKIDEALAILLPEDIDKSSEMGNYMYSATAYRVLSQIFFSKDDIFHAQQYGNRAVELSNLSRNPIIEIETLIWIIILNFKNKNLFHSIYFLRKLMSATIRLDMPVMQKITLILNRLVHRS